jgi:FecR protein
MARRSTTRLALESAAILCTVVGGAGWIFARTVYRAPPDLRAAAPKNAPHVDDEAVVEAVTGPVQRSTSAGDWAALVAGERLRADESLRTGRGARTDLRIGERARLTLAESSQLTIREISSDVHRFQLTRGRVKADYPPEAKRVVRIESAGGVAESRGARFSVLSTGTAIAIATDAGAVTLRGTGGAVEVRQGQQAVAAEGQSPSASEPIPASVLLKVANAAAATDGLCATVEGVAPPGSEVTVDGKAAAVGADGSFRVPVERAAEGREVLVALRDAAGREDTRKVRCVDPPARIRDFAIHWRRRPP